MRKWFEELVINPNLVVSSLCYSIFRVEPYSTCLYSCIYCFRRWVAKERRNPINIGQIRAFKSLSKLIEARKIRTIPFRISTLCDPFSPLENKFRATLKLLRIARGRRIPLIISTKSNLLAKNPWFSEIAQLSELSLVVVQFTLTTLEKELSKKLEPLAPSPEERLDAMEKLHKVGTPIALRLQPIVPGINDSPDSMRRLIKESRSAGAKRVIIESLRMSLEDPLMKEFQLKMDEFTSYYGSKHLLTPKTEYKRKLSETILRIASSHEMQFSGCKETFFDLYTSKNCCGIDLLENSCTRITLKEILSEETGKEVESVLNELIEDEEFIEAHLDELPRPIARKIMAHHRLLRKVVRSERALKALFPHNEMPIGLSNHIPSSKI